MPDFEAIKLEIEKRGLTAYQISKNTPLSEAGIQKIITGENKARASSLALLNSYLFGEKENLVNIYSNNLKELSTLRKIRGIKWNDLANGLPITGEGLRIAFHRGNVQSEYIPIINKNLNGGQLPDETEKAPLQDVRLEKIISKEVSGELKPFLNELQQGQAKTHNDNQEIFNIIQKLTLRIEEMQSQLNQLQEK